MRFWWKQTVTELQDNWRKATRDWSDLGEGSISYYDDKAVVVCGEESQEVEVWVWLRPRAGVRGTSDWGGRLRVKDNTSVKKEDNDQVYLKLSNGSQGQILIGHSNLRVGMNPLSQALFHGQGVLTFPAKTQ